VIWRAVDDQGAWDKLYSEMGGGCYLQSWLWGEHRALFGWQPVRCAAFGDDQRPKAIVQFLVRRFPGKSGIAWVPGGPLGKLSIWRNELLSAVRVSTGLHHILLKANILRQACKEDEAALKAGGWRRSSHPLTSGLSLLWDLGASDEQRYSALSKNWRRNLNRSEKYGLQVEAWRSPYADQIAELYAEMEQLKGLEQQQSTRTIQSMIDLFGDRLLFYRCLDNDGNIVAMRACLHEEGMAWDLMAAAGTAARKTYATYATLWRLAQDCHHLGVKTFDFSGVDPQGNTGVWNFKRGTGASNITYLGEWEIASSEWLRRTMNLGIRMRGTRL